MAYKVFTNGSVLNASEINDNLMNQSVMVFSNSTARSAALTAPVEGMLTWLEDVNRYENYNGSAWVAFGQSNSGLELIKAQTIGSAVSSVEVTDAFSSTYDSYRISLSGGASSASYANIGLRLGATTTGYGHALYYAVYSTSEAAIDRSGNAANWPNAFAGQTTGLTGIVDVINPNLAKNTFLAHVRGTVSTSAFGGGYLNDTTQYTSFTITPGSGTLTGGTIAVYGYRKA